MARVVVIGGGYGGVTVAKGLDPVADVTLIEQKDQFVHHAAALRAAVDDVWEHAIFMPYSYLLQNGRVIRGTVGKVDDHKVYVFGQEPIEADYIVFATGSTYPFPAKHSATSQASVAKARIEQLHENLASAQSVLLVGGGTVGLELAGELAHSFPHLEIQIVEKEDTILPTPGYTEEFRVNVRQQVDELGATVYTGSELAFLPPTSIGELGHFRVETKAGQPIEADIWFQCYGAQPASGFLRGTEFGSALNQDGTIKVQPTLQVQGFDNVYAVGDITDVPESKRADAARHQARVVVANIAEQIEGNTPDVIYRPTKEWVVLPLGPELGASQLLDADGNTRVIGASQTAEIKGTDLMVSVIRSQLNLP
ncbi:FAD-dependent oxidoreductase [Actinomycetaceae bacterium WB03_NA08]|uniref:FAD-dependent oxidoreductase n=1 Tax=Scrofimicrobium canadense TaxID=2652290 RepID=A0A6N7VQK5_9ACTO|nr:FAD-dependent oxidoreductase [Scrofimicrobium canadense]MSS84014.1 FAD-dependent oxidoreductase [Scrofimicrobium canadense]